MKELFSALYNMLSSGEGAAMVTIIESHGSTPRGAGARMLVGRDGYTYGTVGGGAIEYKATQLALEALMAESCFERDFSLSDDCAAELGMVCGGKVRLLFQYVAPESAGFASRILEAATGTREQYLVTEIATGAMRLSDAPEAGGGLFQQPISARGTVYIFGGGHVAQALVPVLVGVGFRCEVLDDRPEFADAALFPGAAAARAVDFGNLALDIAPSDYIVIMTRGHLSDREVLLMALHTGARYIGMMGSAKKRAAVYQSILDAGLDEVQFARVHSPIGLSIKAETPSEIAISIAAELILSRAGE